MSANAVTSIEPHKSIAVKDLLPVMLSGPASFGEPLQGLQARDNWN
jgi:hypothetical protein